MVAILVLLYIQFRTWKDALIVLGTLPFGAIGGVLTLFLTRTNFSISAAVGFTSLTGVATLGAVVFLSGIRRAQAEDGFDEGLKKGIGAQGQQPLARIVVGGMFSTVIAILFMMPLLIHLFRSKHDV